MDICIDLRDWLREVEQHSGLKHISRADCYLEMGGIVEIIAAQLKDKNPVLMFDNILGYPKGFRTLFGIFGIFVENINEPGIF